MTKVLIIEDDKVVSSIYRKKLEEAGLAVEVCEDGQEGFYRIHETQFGAVLLDLILPGMSGVNVIKKIRAQSRFQNLPIFVLTNAFFDNAASQAKEAGATQIFNKAAGGTVALVDAIRQSLRGASPSTDAPNESTAINPLADAEKIIALVAKILSELQHASESSSRLTLIMELLTPVHNLASILTAMEMPSLARLALAIEALLKQLEEQTHYVNESTVRTISMTVKFLSDALALGKSADEERLSSLNILVVDDDPIARRATVSGLAKAALKCVAVKNPEVAEILVEENAFDLIILDVVMPGMDGFELCQKIRQTEVNKKTPVLFVTSLSDLQSRSASVMFGGTDFIAKPFLALELALKALTHVTRVQTGLA